MRHVAGPLSKESFMTASDLPGISDYAPHATEFFGRGTFPGKDGTIYRFQYHLMLETEADCLNVKCNTDESVATFRPSKADSKIWWASGVTVNTGRNRIASNFYAIARDVLRPFGFKIGPSDQLFQDGRDLWSFLDPSMEFEEIPHMPGYFQPVAK